MKIKNVSPVLLTYVLSIAVTFSVSSQNNYRKPLTKEEENTISKGSNVDQGIYQKNIDSIKKFNNQQKLLELFNEFSKRNKQNKKVANAFAKANNIPTIIEKTDGTYMELQFIADDGTPIYYTTYNADAAVSTRANYLNTGGGLGLNLNGDNLTAHVWDAGIARATHQEYDGAGGANRFSVGDGTTTLNFHAAHVTGTIIASGVQAQAKGMAWQANAIGYDWNNDKAEATTAASGGMLISNHSYGYDATAIPDAWFGQYGQDARDWDNILFNAPYYLMMVAAGNDGNDNTSNAIPLDGQAAYDKLNGHATAKNNLVVANGNDAIINPDGSLNSVTRNSSSSEGPTDDYRIKPDIMGNGTQLYSTYESSNTAYASITGTSMASPNVAGTLILLQEHYFNLHGNFMRAATLKGLALHTADDVTPTGPDAQTGWGLLNAKKAAETLTTAATTSGSAIVSELTLTQGQTYSITVQSNGVDPLMASISWTDPAGAVNNGTNSNTPALVNDLDVRLSNGTTYTPWKLTGVTTNGTGDNLVDPYERIDINGASGSYTLTVTHKGTLSGGAQNFSLIVTGVVVATTPVIAYATTVGNQAENTDCNFTDVTVPLTIAQAPSADADVTFVINGSSTATTALDFDLLTPNVTFPAGSTASQNMVLRVYHDGFIEGDETVVIDFTVNPNGGDATADLNNDTFTLTINDDDFAPVASTTVTLLNENFETTPAGWTARDRDGDGFNWTIGTVPATFLSTNQLYSRSWDSTAGPLTPDNYVITSQITIPADLTSLNLEYQVAPGTLTNPWYQEYYTVYWATDVSTYAVIDASPQVKPGAIIAQAVVQENIDMSAYIGQTGYLVFRHHNCTDQEYIAIDNMLLSGVRNTNIQTAVNTGTTEDTQSLPTSGTIYTADSVTGNLMADITNNNNGDYGCVTISVSRAGTGAQSYNGSTTPDLVMDKTFTISPALNFSPESTTTKFYFTEAEIAGWEAVTGLNRNQLVIGRESGGTIVETATPTIGAFGTHVTLTGNFTGLNGTYYFGTANSFVSTCLGVTKTWDGTVWSPAGIPDATTPVVLNGNYNTTANGNLTACTLSISNGATLTVNANDFIQIENDITVNGTLIVEHQGSVVQVNDAASVTNNGTINVNLTTPNLASRDFMVMGSPMTAETRNGVFNSAFLVLNHTTANFVPNAAVAAAFPAAENFADDNYDNWNPYSGIINPAEGYIVRPQSGYGQPGGVFNMTYQLGTLNNGIVNFNVVYNTSKNDSPNVLANPYASAIFADDFINANSMIDEVYFWEHLTPPSPTLPGAGAMNFSMEDISMYNLLGGTPAASDPGTTTTPNGYIATGQGFGIKATAAGTAVFNNTMRRNTGNNTLRNPIEKDRIWLTVRNNQYEMQNTTLVGFTEASSEDFDNGYDSRRLATVVSLYSHLPDGGMELGIQGREAFNEDITIPMGFSTLIDETVEYKISITDIQGPNITQTDVYLIDSLTGTVTNLNQDSYSFTSGKATYNNRFTLLFKNPVLSNEDIALSKISLYPNPTSGTVTVVSPNSPITRIQVTDIRGRKVNSLNGNNQNTISFSVETLQNAMYFIKIQTQKGSIIKRIIIKK